MDITSIDKKRMVAVLTSEAKVKNISVACHCGTKTVHQVPGEILDAQLKPVLECTNCQQLYTIFMSKLIRLDNHLHPTKICGTEATHTVVDKDGAEELSVNVIDEMLKVAEKPGNFPVDTNKTIH